MTEKAQCVVQVFFTPETRPNDRAVFELVETEFEDFASFLDAISDPDRLLCVSRLVTYRGEEHNTRYLQRREAFAFRGRAVSRAQLPRYRILEMDVAE
ncbi:hypothetical protein [Salipiger sp.]|uniref:hypothetical protein n=1 Tax=Salipiger sp. TaxID=2078585 RepID=UPI003A97EAE9